MGPDDDLDVYQEMVEVGYPGVTYQEVIRDLSPAFSRLSDGEIDAVVAGVLGGMSPEEVESFWKSVGSLAKTAGKSLVRAAPTVLPVAGAAIGTMIGGPAGTAIGGQLGGLAGGMIGRAAAPQRPRVVARPTRRGAPSPVPAGASSATAQLMALLQNPVLLQSLLSRILGRPGEAEVSTGTGILQVPFGAVMNALECLAAEAAREAHAVAGDTEAYPEYLLDGEGTPAVDTSVAEERAGRLLAILRESSLLESREVQSVDRVSAWMMEAGLIENNA